jgi:hypothetical protein
MVVASNQTNGTITITGIASSNPGFVPGLTLPATLGPLASSVIGVRFAPASPGAHAGVITLTTNPPVSGAQFSVSGTSTGGGATVTLAIDGGTFNGLGGFPAGVTGYYVNRLTPPRYPATLRSVLVFFPGGELPVGAQVTIVSAAHPAGAGGAQITGPGWQRTAAAVPAVETFSEVAVPPLSISSGDFLVGFSVVNPPGAFPVAIDISTAPRQRSYISSDGVSFRLTDTTPLGPGNFGIRAKVEGAP